MRRPEPELPDHGAHTLRVLFGTIVGIDGEDVFVELGPRMQGVIARRAFPEPPSVGEEYSFTLGGQEEGLWALSLTVEPVLSTWENLEVGSLVQGRVVREKPGGLEVKVGALHAFLPKSQTGLDRGEDPGQLVGKVMTFEVTEVDPERQRCSVSRKLVIRRERENERQRRIGSLVPGAIVQGRVSRVESYGVFVRFGHGLEGLIHVSNLAWERVDDPASMFEKGAAIDAKVLHVKQGGRRIGLGLKQLGQSPWKAFAADHAAGELVEGRVTRIADFGLFVRVAPGIEGLVHRSETGRAPGEPLSRLGGVGATLCTRILHVDATNERLSLSLLDRSGRRLAPEEAESGEAFRDLAGEVSDAPASSLGRLLREALEEPREPPP